MKIMKRYWFSISSALKIRGQKREFFNFYHWDQIHPKTTLSIKDPRERNFSINFRPTFCAKEEIISPQYFDVPEDYMTRFNTNSHAVQAVLFKPSPLPPSTPSVSNQLTTLWSPSLCLKTNAVKYYATRRLSNSMSGFPRYRTSFRVFVKVFQLYQGLFEISSFFISV